MKRSTMSSCSSQLYSNFAMFCLPKLNSVMYLMSMKRVAIYARSSPDCPLMADEQISQLSKVAAEHGWTVANVFTDCPTSVKKDQDRRRGELALIGAIRSEAIDRVLIWSIDRVGKCLVDLIGFIETCRSAHVALNLCDEDLIARPRVDYRCWRGPILPRRGQP